MSSDAVVIVAAKRTPIGAFLGTLSGATSPQLGAAAIKGAIDASGVDAADVNRVLMGCVLPAGLGQAPARQAALGAGLPEGVPCVTVNKMCGSGLETIILAHDMIKAGSAGIVVAGGLESMSNAPYMLPKARSGMRMGEQQALDHMFTDGLQDPYSSEMMGHFAQVTADKYGFTREEMDAFATESATSAQRAVSDGSFVDEISPVTISSRRGDVTVTAATSSSISDGAAAVVMMSEAEAGQRGLQPIARIVAHSAFAHEPAWFTTAPVYALKKLHDSLGWTPADVDLYEINEAFAVVTMAALKDVGISHDKVNINEATAVAYELL
jgi:acetyl-CoA C-acetyltransferase